MARYTPTPVTHFTVEHDFSGHYVARVPLASIPSAIDTLYRLWLKENEDEWTDGEDAYDEYACDIRITPCYDTDEAIESRVGKLNE